MFLDFLRVFSHFLHNFFRNFFFIFGPFLWFCQIFYAIFSWFYAIFFACFVWFFNETFYYFLVTVCNLQGSSITPISVWKGESFKGHTRFDKWQKTLTVIICQTSKSRNKSQQFFFTFRAFFRCCKLSWCWRNLLNNLEFGPCTRLSFTLIRCQILVTDIGNDEHGFSPKKEIWTMRWNMATQSFQSFICTLSMFDKLWNLGHV